MAMDRSFDAMMAVPRRGGIPRWARPAVGNRRRDESKHHGYSWDEVCWDHHDFFGMLGSHDHHHGFLVLGAPCLWSATGYLHPHDLPSQGCTNHCVAGRMMSARSDDSSPNCSLLETVNGLVCEGRLIHGRGYCHLRMSLHRLLPN